MRYEIALAGNPNSGKTTLFNGLTGSRQHVGNWPGVTVEKKEGKLKGKEDVLIVDLPGIYSLSPYTLEEVVSRKYLIHETPDAILNIVDGTNLERNLYLTTQLLELGIPMVVAINMMDQVRKNKTEIDLEKLSKHLGCPVVEISALKEENIFTVAEAAIALVQEKRKPAPLKIYDKKCDDALHEIGSVLTGKVDSSLEQWYRIKFFEKDEKVMNDILLKESEKEIIKNAIQEAEAYYEDDSESIITSMRYDWIGNTVKESVRKRKEDGTLSFSDKIDKVVTNRILALPIFALVMLGIYTIAMGSTPFSIGTRMTDWTNDVLFGEWVPGIIQNVLTTLNVSDVLSSLILDGIVSGVGAVLGFVPQILVLFLFLSALEDCGYMSRVAFIMDRIFRRFGLSGKSFIPMLVATGCGVPGIMASRTIEQERDRRMTIITTGFIPCGAKMPIIGLFAGALFQNNPWVATSAFFIGICAVVVSGIILKKTKAFAGDPAPFIMELPSYHLPSFKNVSRTTFERGWSFIKRAGTVILLSSIVLWFLQGFGMIDGQIAMVEDNNTSFLAIIGKTISWILYPLGWVGDMAWKATVATFTGLIAKEEVVNTFGVLYRFGGELSETGEEVWSLVSRDFTALSAYSFMIFNLLCAPCFAAMGAIKREMNNPKWTAFAIGYMCIFAYVASMIVYQLGAWVTGEVNFGFLTVVAIGLLVGIVYLLLRKGYSKVEGV